MATDTTASGRMMKGQAKEFTTSQMVVVIRDFGNTTKCMVKAPSIGLTGTDSKEPGQEVSHLVKAHFSTQMAAPKRKSTVDQRNTTSELA